MQIDRARLDRKARTMAGLGLQGALPVPCHSRELGGRLCLPNPGGKALELHTRNGEARIPTWKDTDDDPRKRLATQGPHSPPLA